MHPSRRQLEKHHVVAVNEFERQCQSVEAGKAVANGSVDESICYLLVGLLCTLVTSCYKQSTHPAAV